MSVFFKRLRATNFGCLKDIDIHLTPLHAFIGPNDSGKSTVLRALRTIVHLAADRFTVSTDSQGHHHGWDPFDPGVSPRNSKFELTIFLTDEIYYKIKSHDKELIESVELEGDKTKWGGKTARRQWTDKTHVHVLSVIPAPMRRDLSAIDGARLVRFDPDLLKAPSALITENEMVRFFDDRGAGLPGVYDAIRNRGDDSYDRIAEKLRRLFPTVKNLKLKVTSPATKELEIELVDGQRIPARFMSEGMLLFLAFEALAYLAPTSILLVEEPENGLHPARIADVMRVLREISDTSQVVIATHSPLVINELEGNEVTVLTRDLKKGTQAHLLSETPNFEERKKVYALGELWLSYANGEDEAPLLTGKQKI